LVVHRIPAGMSPEELVRGAAGRPSRFFEEWSFGGPAVPRDSTNDATVTMELRPGRYAFISYEVDATGRPRGDRYKWLMITAIRTSALIPSRFAVPDVTLKIKDARIDVIGALRRGQRTFQVENIGAQAHDLMIVRVNSGKTVEDVQRWLRDRRGSAPFFYVGGITPLSPGVTTQTRHVLQSGTHVVLSTMGGDYQRGVITTIKVT
jgi:hypothetical protein